MSKRVIITGATGMVGKGVLYECLEHEEIEEVLLLNRSSLDIEHSKISEILIEDFSDFNEYREDLKGYDACFFCMGVSAGRVNESTFKKITYDYTLALAKVLKEVNTSFTFIYVSGQGTDSSEKGRMMWARVKGKVENDLMKMNFEQSLMFRPGAIIPLKGIKSKTPSYQIIYTYFGWLLKLIKWISPNSMLDTTEIGLAMINSLLKGSNKNILEPKDIKKLAEIST